jgi:threonine aldolase
MLISINDKLIIDSDELKRVEKDSHGAGKPVLYVETKQGRFEKIYDEAEIDRIWAAASAAAR